MNLDIKIEQKYKLVGFIKYKKSYSNSFLVKYLICLFKKENYYL